MDGPALLVCFSLIAVNSDTVTCDGQRLRPMGNGAPFVAGFDAPEVGHRAACDAERNHGARAKARMAELLAGAGLTVETFGASDRYGRPLVVLRQQDGSSIGFRLIAEGVARIWPADAEHSWCD